MVDVPQFNVNPDEGDVFQHWVADKLKMEEPILRARAPGDTDVNCVAVTV